MSEKLPEQSPRSDDYKDDEFYAEGATTQNVLNLDDAADGSPKVNSPALERPKGVEASPSDWPMPDKSDIETYRILFSLFDRDKSGFIDA
jgi:hypothetical protein